VRQRVISVVALAGAIASALSVSLALAGTSPGPPKANPPKPAGRDGPPPVWVESTSESVWLAYGSYCWATQCVDYIGPALRAGIPVLRVARRTVVRLHFGFRPKTVSVGYIREGAPPHPLAPTRVTLWRPSSGGRFELQVRAAKGSASYVGSVQIK
jgi:hypothetical protein